VWVYGQTEVTKVLMAAHEATGSSAFYEVSDVVLHDVASDRPSVTFTDRDRREQRVEADAVAGCDGFHGPSRTSIPSAVGTPGSGSTPTPGSACSPTWPRRPTS
jgi:p-hydroxybenzoate 3-monooxygenase